MIERAELTEPIIRAALDVHTALGPGLLESVYEASLAHELLLRGVAFERQKALPVIYKGVTLDCGFQLDLLVGGIVVVEIKAVDALLPIHEAQLLTYLRLTGCKIGLLINFNTRRLREGIKRIVLNL